MKTMLLSFRVAWRITSIINIQKLTLVQYICTILYLAHTVRSYSMQLKSILKNNLTISNELCVVSLVRKVEEGNEIFKKENGFRDERINKEHAFILVEGLNQFNKVFFIRYDLVMNQSQDHKCQVIINERNASINPEEAPSVLRKILNGDVIAGKDWTITKKEALQLHENILKSQKQNIKHPENYNLFGEKASIPRSSDAVRESNPKSAEHSSASIEVSCEKVSGRTAAAYTKEILSPAGKNCYDWAREMLLSIHNPKIKEEMPHSPFELIATKPSSLLPKNADDKPGACCVM